MDVVSCLYEGVVPQFYEGVMACLGNDNKDNFDVDIRNRLDDCFEYFLLA